MSRSLTIRKPTSAEIRQLQNMLEDELNSWQRRRAEVILLYAAGISAVEMAQLLEAHYNTIYADLHLFEKQGLESIEKPRRVGAPTRITETQIVEALRLIETPPYELGLPYGRWSLTKLREYLIKDSIIKYMSRERVGSIFKKKGSMFVDFGA